MLFSAIRMVHTLFVCLLVPVYCIHYGPQNFLWFSDIALLASVVALWRRSSLIASTQLASVFIIDALWSLDFLAGLILGEPPMAFSTFMFDASYPMVLRLLSLFHLWLPWLLLWMVFRYGYDRRALAIQTAVCGIVLVASYFISTPEENINWVFSLGDRPQTLPPPAYLALLMISMPTIFYVPVHAVLLRWDRHSEAAPAATASP